MPPKPIDDSYLALFKSIGLTQSKAVEAAKNPKNAEILKDLIERYDLREKGELGGNKAVLVVALANQIGKLESGQEDNGYVIKKILDEKLKTVDQVNGENL